MHLDSDAKLMYFTYHASQKVAPNAFADFSKMGWNFHIKFTLTQRVHLTFLCQMKSD